jgi:hypothetical protein
VDHPNLARLIRHRDHVCHGKSGYQ